MRLNTALKLLHVGAEASSSIHENVSRGYYKIDPKGGREFVPYSSAELGEIHTFISPAKNRYNHMKWTKTKEWKDKDKAKKSRWKQTKVYSGLNTVNK